jgi:hypothetical protein
MSEAEQKSVLVKRLSKKEAKNEVFNKLSNALAEYKNQLGKKKFEYKIKKASKLFALDIAKGIKKERKPLKEKKVSKAK